MAMISPTMSVISSRTWLLSSLDSSVRSTASTRAVKMVCLISL